MEKVVVDKFLIISSAEFEVKRVNIIIGPQAHGKSLLAKLLYFFREVISDIFLDAVGNLETQKELNNRVVSLFEKYFPKYTWIDQEIKIEYQLDDIYINISKTNKQKSLKIEYSKYFSSIFRQIKNKYKNFLNTFSSEKVLILDEFWNFKEKYLINNDIYPYLNDPIFIPAGRSFFANLQKNIFSLLSENIDIDPFIKDFGSKYEVAKRVYIGDELLFQNGKTFRKMNTILEKILNGEYEYKDKQDWIKTKNNLINLANASSGQQESLPMLLILSTFSFINTNIKKTYFIEEPEAHLFPTSQKYIVEFIGLLYNNSQDIVITTHSPYILTALNNLILANDIKNQKGTDSIKDIIDEEFCIAFDDVSAYNIEDGKLDSIVDKDERLIGVNVIDLVSEELSGVFDRLLSLED